MSQQAVRTMTVEMFGFQMVPGEDQQSVGAFAADAADPPFGICICSWSLRWCPQHGDAGRCKDGVEGVGDLGVPVADEEAKPLGALVQVHEQVPGLLRHPHTRRVPGDAQHVDPSAGDLHHEEHIQPLQQDRIHGEEIAGENTASLGAQKRNPRRVGPPWCRIHPCPAQDPPHGGCADTMAEPDQLAVDVPVPQVGFSPASCSTSWRISRRTGGRPGVLCG